MTEGPIVAVVGVGNPVMGDDGLGEHVIRRLQEEGLPSGMEATHAGTTAFFALEAMSGADYAIIVDAVETGESPPGSVHRYRYREGSFDGSPPEVLMHDFSFSTALRAGTDVYDIPEELLVIGVEPAATDPGLDLSDPVENSVPAVIEEIYDEVETVSVPLSRRRTEPTAGSEP
ncbi:MAG: hydrogenase maturation protease [Halapricum sp.]